MYESILYEVKEGLAIITMNRPEKLNSFHSKMRKEMKRAVREAAKSSDVRALVITGAGRAFSAGQDLGEVDESIDYAELLRNEYNPMIEEIAGVDKPVIAAVNGTAAGAGFSLAMACDFRIASDKASFIQAFIHVGLVPDSGSLYFLPRMIGHARALELMAFGEKVDAAFAKELGLVSEVLESECWEEGHLAFARRAAALPPSSFRLLKRCLSQSWEMNLSEVLEKEALAQGIAGRSEDHKEGMAAFLEKRKPSFTGG